MNTPCSRALAPLLLLAFVAVCQSPAEAQTNLALSATGSASTGGSGTYGPTTLNDTVLYTPWSWVSNGNNSTLDEFFQLTWSSSVTIGSFKWFGPQGWPGYRVTQVDLQHWNGSSWVTDASAYAPSSYSGPDSNDWTYTYSSAITTTQIRAVLIYSATPSWPNQFCSEWEVYAPTGPAAPASISVPATSNTGSYTVSWSSVTGATSYDLQEDTSASFPAPTTVYSGANTSFGVTGKGNGSYYYRVRANDSSGSSTWTVGANPCVVTLPPPAPASLTVPATSVTGNFTVSWSAVATASSYDLQEANNASFAGAATVYSGANLSFNVTGKTSGTWFYQVRAVNAGGNSAWTQGANGCQIVAPAPPVPLTVPSSSTTGAYTVSWGSSTGATAYELQEDSSSAFGNPSTLVTGPALSTAVSGRTNGTWFYRVRASNGAGASAWTTDTTGCAVTLAVPAAPATVTVPASSSTGNYVVTWSPVAGAVRYEVEESTDPGFGSATRVYAGPSASWYAFGRANGTYYYRVRAVNSAGASAWTAGPNGCVVAVTGPGLLVRAGPCNPGASAEAPGATGVRMLQLEISAGSAEAVQLQSMTLHASGSGNDATEMGAVFLWLDVDGNGFADVGETLLGTGSFAADNGSLAFDLTSSGPLAQGTTAWLLATGNLLGTAAAGSGFSLGLSPATDVVARGASSANPASIAGPDSWGGLKTVATSGPGSLSMSLGARSPGPGRVDAPAGGVPMLQVALAASSLEDVRVSRLRVRAFGTGNDAGAAARLYLDADDDGAVSAADTALGTQAVAGDDGAATFAGLALTVPAGTHLSLLVALDFEAGYAGTCSISVDADTDVEAAGVTSGSWIAPTGAPVLGAEKTVAGGGSAEPVFFIGPCGGPVGPGGWAGLLLLAVVFACAKTVFRASRPCRIPRKKKMWTCPLPLHNLSGNK